MKVSIEWLNDFLNLSEWPATVIADRMSRTGIEIEGVENFADAISNVVVGQVEKVQPHPNSDHLHICQVNTGEAAVRQIVCGASNVTEGAKVIVALPGATLLGGVEIKSGQLRGETSEGMLCALQELGFSDSVVPKVYAEGLFLLPSDAPIGMSVVEYLKLDDAILELSITPNRADALSMRGVAYEVGAIVSQEPQLTLDDIALWSDSDAFNSMQITLSESELAPHYQLRLIENVEVKESPIWLQVRLMKAGIRPLNNIVDLTNYFLLLYGQPMHAFDYDKITHNHIQVRRAKNEEAFTTLDGTQRTLTVDDIVISDGDVPVALAGVMGGLDSEVTDTTRNILLETAIFNPLQVRTTSKRFNLRSESSARFEKGINKATLSEAGEQAALWIAKLGGGRVAKRVVEHKALEVEPVEVTVAYSQIPNKLGIELTQEELQTIFVRLGFQARYDETTFTVAVPPRRWDISIEADILEEVARIYGYDNLPTTLPAVPSTPGQLSKKQRLVRQTRAICEGFGLNQTISYVLTSPKQAELLQSKEYAQVKLDFPMSEERSVLRQSMFPALLEIAKYNHARNNKPLAFYEVGKVFFSLGRNVQPLEQERLALFISGQKIPSTWYNKAEAFTFFDLKGMLEAYFEAIRLTNQVSYEPVSDIKEMHPGRTARILLDGQPIGLVGQLHPALAKEYDLNEESYFAEVDLDKVLATHRPALVQSPIPKFPSTSRDLALLVDMKLSNAVLESVIRQHGGESLLSLELFDLFIDENIFKGKKSLAYRLTFQNPERTLTDEDVLKAMAHVTEALQQIKGLEIR